jgi:hypothetical protein
MSILMKYTHNTSVTRHFSIKKKTKMLKTKKIIFFLIFIFIVFDCLGRGGLRATPRPGVVALHSPIPRGGSVATYTATPRP